MYHLYSHNDLDGVGCGIIAKCAFGDGVDVRYNTINGLNQQVARYLNRFSLEEHPYDMLFITDLSVAPDIEKQLNLFVEEGGQVQLIDHHKTALHLNDYMWGQVTVTHRDGRLASATSLLYEYLIQHGHLSQSESLDQFVELVRLYDTWEWEEAEKPEAKRLNDLFYMLSIDEFESKMVERLRSAEEFYFDEFEEKILDMEEDKIGRYIRRKQREIIQTFIDEYCVGIVYAESYHSELASELGTIYPHLDYIAILNMGGRKLSLRTIHDHVDVSEVAMRYGGGGHSKASGCTITEEVYRLFAAEPFELEPIRLDAHRNQFNLKGSESGVLYESWGEDLVFVYCRSGEWIVEWNGEELPFRFGSFDEAERHLKRQYGVWLARDDAFVRMLKDQLMQRRSGERLALSTDMEEEKLLEEL
ncbi:MULTISPECIES: DHH family phosphoesterase [Paenibacillus]|uniref:Oligoribonuclease NrnB/cAMP/cGMP phosphodiesterase (DHH superfamily) n=1 Tax=Paenibacillus lactis TaxID=228574 RepID=A0ABS4FG73_9BACL|nr:MULTISPECIES: oligoribonuclease [Paenibacillus]MBP1895251.1 oligoribonuclease NrnB/cAMP/cGMP phosphodiesterase (DHH superfamily) [Paenibacillus lactis]HAF97730.1 oligoribonuclease [Paenibacillus lactis]